MRPFLGMRPIFLLALVALFPASASCSEPTVNPQDVQWQVNYQIEYRLDPEGTDVWRIPRDTGDCEDIALLKRQKLIEGGFDPEDLQIHIVVIPDFGGHAILYITSLDLVLDNNEHGVMSWETWAAEHKPRLSCVASDLTPGNIFPVSSRCEGPLIRY